MEAYAAPPDLTLAVCGLLGGIIIIGLGLSRSRPSAAIRTLAWLLVPAAIVVADRISSEAPAGFRMLAICGATLFSMKAVVSVESSAAGDRPPPWSAWLLWCVPWFGMRPAIFARRGTSPLPGARTLALRGATRGAIGLLFVGCAWWLAPHTSLAVATVPLLVGLSLCVHFGAFNLIAAALRSRGYNVKALFRAPLLSTSLREFWGKRWNLAFSEMAAIAVFRPLKRPFGATPATVVAFLFSGLLHEIAISLPVRGGYGLPLVYFVLHGILMQVETALDRRGRPIDARPWVGRLWTVSWLVLPAPILFHPAFLEGVAFPLLS
ncbi:MAG: hypothetical protein CMJ83_20390 [Planctomycetes bacterium]|nr:hypothetical protein [Planctomycetota bacterium]